MGCEEEKKETTVLSLNNKEQRQKRGNNRRFQFLSTYFLTANTIFGCGLLSPQKSAEDAHAVAPAGSRLQPRIRPTCATWDRLCSSHLFEWDLRCAAGGSPLTRRKAHADLYYWLICRKRQRNVGAEENVRFRDRGRWKKPSGEKHSFMKVRQKSW